MSIKNRLPTLKEMKNRLEADMDALEKKEGKKWTQKERKN